MGRKNILLLAVILVTLCVASMTFMELYFGVTELEARMEDATEEALESVRGAATSYELSLGWLDKIIEETETYREEDFSKAAEYQTRFDTADARYKNIIASYGTKIPQPKPYTFDATDLISALGVTVAPFRSEKGFVLMSDVLSKYIFKDADGAWNAKGTAYKCDHKCRITVNIPSVGESSEPLCDDHIKVQDAVLQTREISRLMWNARKQGLFNRDHSSIPQ